MRSPKKAATAVVVPSRAADRLGHGPLSCPNQAYIRTLIARHCGPRCARRNPRVCRHFAAGSSVRSICVETGVPGSSPGLAILKAEIPLGYRISLLAAHRHLELPTPRAEIVVVSVRVTGREPLAAGVFGLVRFLRRVERSGRNAPRSPFCLRFLEVDRGFTQPALRPRVVGDFAGVAVARSVCPSTAVSRPGARSMR